MREDESWSVLEIVIVILLIAALSFIVYKTG